MYIDENSVVIDNISMAQYILEAKFGYHKQWSSDSGRNMAMETTGTFNIFPKITLTFRKLNKDELAIIAPILNKQSQTTKYYDPEFEEITTMQTYTGDWEIISKRMKKGESFTCAFISRKRRVQS